MKEVQPWYSYGLLGHLIIWSHLNRFCSAFKLFSVVLIQKPGQRSCNTRTRTIDCLTLQSSLTPLAPSAWAGCQFSPGQGSRSSPPRPDPRSARWSSSWSSASASPGRWPGTDNTRGSLSIASRSHFVSPEPLLAPMIFAHRVDTCWLWRYAGLTLMQDRVGVFWYSLRRSLCPDCPAHLTLMAAIHWLSLRSRVWQ